MDVKINLNFSKIEAKIEKAREKALFETTQQALKDCNYYCKQDQGTLISSSQIFSDPSAGRMVWHTPYARMQYYLDSANKHPNAAARKMWAHYAASVHGNAWLELFKESLRRHMKGR